MPREVEFDHRRLKSEVQVIDLNAPASSGLARRVKSSATVGRGLFVVLGAAAIAFATQRAGIALSGALCLFFGALPVLWVGGWLFGALVSARSVARDTTQRMGTMGSARWQQQMETVTQLEKVKLEVRPEHLALTRDGQLEQVPWAELTLERAGGQSLLVFRRAGPHALRMSEPLTVPRTAFGSDDAFDEFCLAMQREIWRADRR